MSENNKVPQGTKKLDPDDMAYNMSSEEFLDILPRFSVICMCGSVRFKKEFLEWACKLSEDGYIVLMPNCLDNHAKYNDNKDEISRRTNIGIDLMHFRKIELSNSIFVVDVNGYIGESTAREIAVAKKLKKRIRYLSDIYQRRVYKK